MFKNHKLPIHFNVKNNNKTVQCKKYFNIIYNLITSHFKHYFYRLYLFKISSSWGCPRILT